MNQMQYPQYIPSLILTIILPFVFLLLMITMEVIIDQLE